VLAVAHRQFSEMGGDGESAHSASQAAVVFDVKRPCPRHAVDDLSLRKCTMRVLVTGAAGFIGSALSCACSRAATRCGLDNLNDYYDPTLKEARLAG
jgi:stage III sporulation protein SpoIIIAA